VLKRSKEEKRVLAAVRMARMAVPSYGRGRAVTRAEAAALMRLFNVDVLRGDLVDVPALLTPPVHGRFRLILDHRVGPDVARFIELHEVGHVATGDADEPTVLQFTGPLPEAEEVADLFALLGVLDELDTDQGPAWVEQRIRELVPLDDRGWQVHRIPRLAAKVCRMRNLAKEWLD
jgi:hypothetical protein